MKEAGSLQKRYARKTSKTSKDINAIFDIREIRTLQIKGQTLCCRQACRAFCCSCFSKIEQNTKNIFVKCYKNTKNKNVFVDKMQIECHNKN